MQVISVLQQSKNIIIDYELTNDIEWSILMLQSNKLLDHSTFRNANNAETQQWMDQYDVSSAKRQAKRSAVPRLSMKMASMQRMKKQDTFNINNQIDFQDIPKQALQYLQQNVDSQEFNVFHFNKLAEGDSLIYFIYYMFSTQTFGKVFNLTPSIIHDFSLKVQQNYSDLVPYHNKLHALDVAQTLHFFLSTCRLGQVALETDLEYLACYVAAVAHDLKHPGYNNLYCINSQHRLAILYNDKSVLENYHASSLFTLILTNQSAFLRCLTRSQQERLKSLVINYILATDMAFHFEKIGKVNALFAAGVDQSLDQQNKQLCIEACVHAADISNPSKHIDVYNQWVELVMFEFFQQGDREKEQGLAISMLCDRFTVNIAKSQIGFIDFIVIPIFQSISQFLPELKNHMKNFEINKTVYKLKQE